MYNRKAFKNEAKQLMRAVKPHYMLVALVYFLLTTVLNYGVSALTGMGTFLGGTLSVFLNVLVWLFGIVLSMGLTSYVLGLSRSEPVGVGNLFDGFAFAGRAIGVKLMTMIYVFLWSLLACMAFGIVVAGAIFLPEVLGIILMVAAYIALLVVVFVVILRYSMANFFLVENPDQGVSEAIHRSVQMMRGNIRKLFVMMLSFLGWELLVGLIRLIVLGIGLAVSGTLWMLESVMLPGEDIWAMYTALGGLMERMNLWVLLAEVLSLPLSLWLLVYSQTAFARFYNFVSGYDYHQYVNEQQTTAVSTEEPQAQAEQKPAAAPKPPVGGYYTPAPNLEEPTSDEPDEEEI